MNTHSPDHFLKLQIWLSSMFPVGSFAYSHGLEWAVEANWVTDKNSLSAWIGDILMLGSARNDAILIVETVRAVNDFNRLAEINELALALAPSSERLMESVQQGASFLEAIIESWPTELPPLLLKPPIAYPVAFGLALARHGIAPEMAVPAFLNAFLANLVSAAIRLRVIGQRDAQKILAALTPQISALTIRLANAGLDDLGSATLGVDFAALKHETQDGRLFRS